MQSMTQIQIDRCANKAMLRKTKAGVLFSANGNVRREPVMNMVVDSDILQFRIPMRYLMFADSFLDAAELLNLKMIRDKEANTWQNASVVLMNSAHSFELLLKGLLLHHNAQMKLGSHDLEGLYEKYLVAYPGNEFQVEKLFSTNFGNLSEEEINEFKKTLPEPSVLYRYPTKTGQMEWNGAQGFIAGTFVSEIGKLKTVIRSAKAKIS